MTNKLGLCISPGFIPSPTIINELNPPFVRSIIYSLDDVPKLYAINRPLIITLNNQCKEVGPDWLGWEGVIYSLASTLQDRLLVLGCGNEFDLYWAKNNNDVPPEFAASLAIRAAKICHQFGVKVAPTSLAGPQWAEYLTQLTELCGNDVDYFDIHPYGQQPDGWKPDEAWGFGKLADVIHNVRTIGKRDVICTEYGVKIGDAGGEASVADFLSCGYETLSAASVPYAAWFASEDAVGAPDERGQAAFGLVAEDGRKRPSYTSYQTINAGTDNSVTTITEQSTRAKWKDLVGKDLLEMIIEDGTEPAMASEWRPFNRPSGVAATIEEVIGLNGTTYRWHLPTNNGWRFKPD